MYVARVIPVQESQPQQAILALLGGLLDAGHIAGVLMPSSGTEGGGLRLASTRDELAGYDPLSPKMLSNAACGLPQALVPSEKRVAIALHPCETRTLIEMAKRGAVERDRLLVLGMDCGFGTSGSTADGQQDPVALRVQSLACASAGLPAPAQARMACRLCERPAADLESADVLLGWIGLDPQEKLLLIADEAVDQALGLESLTQRSATEREAVDREMALWRMVDRRKKAALELLEELGLEDGHPAVAAGYLSRCTLCGECLEACALAGDDLRQAMQQGKTVFIQALLAEAQRMASCSGCGFCQANCPEGIPLCAIAYSIGHQIQSRMHYTPGRSLEDPLPWAL
jgi:formate dehydrogenase subunit beta